jgi:hypothetical protein
MLPFEVHLHGVMLVSSCTYQLRAVAMPQMLPFELHLHGVMSVSSCINSLPYIWKENEQHGLGFECNEENVR